MIRRPAQRAIDEGDLNQRRYCVWQCPTHETNQKPRGIIPRAGCGHWQYKKTNPERPSQGRCKKCHKRPRLTAKDYARTYPFDRRGRDDAGAYCLLANNPLQGDDWRVDEDGDMVFMELNQ